MPLWQDRRNLNEATFRIGIGLATGPAIAGNVGSPDRKNETVMGVPVNRFVD